MGPWGPHGLPSIEGGAGGGSHVAKIPFRALGCQEASPFWRKINISGSHCHCRKTVVAKAIAIAIIHRKKNGMLTFDVPMFVRILHWLKEYIVCFVSSSVIFLNHKSQIKINL